MINIDLNIALQIIEKSRAAYAILKNLKDSKDLQKILDKGEDIAANIKEAADDTVELGLLILQVYDEFINPRSRAITIKPLHDAQTRQDVISYISSQIRYEAT